MLCNCTCTVRVRLYYSNLREKPAPRNLAWQVRQWPFTESAPAIYLSSYQISLAFILPHTLAHSHMRIYTGTFTMCHAGNTITGPCGSYAHGSRSWAVLSQAHLSNFNCHIFFTCVSSPALSRYTTRRHDIVHRVVDFPPLLRATK